MFKNLQSVGGYQLDATEIEFAEKIRKTFVGTPPPLSNTALVAPMKQATEAGSTDVGDVSWVVPTVGLSTATWVPGTAAHSWQAVAAGGTSIGIKGMMVAAKSMALTAVDLFSDPKVIEASWVEFRNRTGNEFRYEPLIGNRKPALNYRD
jgi:aminobenzoyl-glutamate utilization protein B